MKKEPTGLDDTRFEEVLVDEESSLQDKFKQYAIYGGGVLAVIIIALITITYYNDHQQEQEAKAAMQLSLIRPAYDAGNFEQALNGNDSQKGLETIAANFGGTEAGKLAALYAGLANLHLGNYEKAQGYFEEAQSADASVTRVGATAGLAACKDQAGQTAASAELFEKTAAMAEQTGNEEHYKLFTAMLLEKAGEKENALRLYREIVAANQFSQFAGEAKAGIVRLGEAIVE